MLNVFGLVVGNVCAICVLFGFIYTTNLSKYFSRCTKSLVVLFSNTIKTQPYPHTNYEFNRQVSRLSHITHRTYKNKDYLYKYIITKHVEVL